MKKIVLILGLILFLCSPVNCAQTDNYTLGKQAYSAGDYVVAHEYFMSVLNKNPQNLRARYYLANTLAKQGKYDDASIEYKRIVQTDPNSEVAQYAQEAYKKISPYLTREPKTIERNETYQVSQNYFSQALSADGQIIRWKAHPILVYVPINGYTDVIKKAFLTWQTGSKGLVSFAYVKNRQFAQIEVKMSDQFNNAGTESGYIAGKTTPHFKGHYLTKADITLLSINPLTKKAEPKDVVFRTALHEVGHALGIMGHSPQASDVMCASGTESVKTLSLRDYNTLKELYTTPITPPNLSQAELDKNIAKASSYAEKNPDSEKGWMNLGDAQRNKKNYDRAIDAYMNVISINRNNHLAYFFIGDCLSKKNIPAIALGYYQQAMDLAPQDTTYVHAYVAASVKAQDKDRGRTALQKYLKAYPKKKNDPMVIDMKNMLK